MGWLIGWTSPDAMNSAQFDDWRTRMSQLMLSDTGQIAKTGWWLQDPARTPWHEEELVPRIVETHSGRAERLKAIGNGQVPLAAALAFLTLMETSKRATA